MTEKRFNIIEHCSSDCALLIDRWNKLASIPLGFSLSELKDDEIAQLNEWLDYLNKGGRDSTQSKLW